MTIMEDAEIMNLNMNRISMIKIIPKLDNRLHAESIMRAKFQDAFKTAETDKEKNDIAKKVEETLNKNIIKTIRSYMKKKR